ncbi:MerR family transcriptional regulator, partial [Candidatus Gottesmanbacteria bacterium]|nr:MerR family transcriptional regulator [Candidatus Gottesmanbacteria bacterium]
MTQKNAYTIGQAATYLGISPDTLRRWETKGKIKPSRTPGGQRLFSEDQLLTIKKLYFEKAPQEFLGPASQALGLRGKTSLRHFLLGLFILSLIFSLAFNAFTSEITKQISQTLTKYITKPPEG